MNFYDPWTVGSTNIAVAGKPFQQFFSFFLVFYAFVSSFFGQAVCPPFSSLLSTSHHFELPRQSHGQLNGKSMDKNSALRGGKMV